MAQEKIIKAFPDSGRGRTDFGWLKPAYSFSFNRFWDPERMGFGLLRVLNDDWVAPGRGFPKHPHEHMEIITIVKEGAVAHEDSAGNQAEVPAGDVQWMSAGNGVVHSEFNPKEDQPLKLFQIWIQPPQQNKDLPPAYGQKTFPPGESEGKWQRLISPDGSQGSIAIRQEAYIHRARLQPGQELTYSLQQPATNGLYLHVDKGQVAVAEHNLGPGDGLGIAGREEITLSARQATEVLALEVPMHPN